MMPRTKHMRRVHAEIIIAMAEADLCVSECARQLGKHRATVESQIFDLIDITGKDARKFYDLCELLPKAKAFMEEL